MWSLVFFTVNKSLYIQYIRLFCAIMNWFKMPFTLLLQVYIKSENIIPKLPISMTFLRISDKEILIIIVFNKIISLGQNLLHYYGLTPV